MNNFSQLPFLQVFFVFNLQCPFKITFLMYRSHYSSLVYLSLSLSITLSQASNFIHFNAFSFLCKTKYTNNINLLTDLFTFLREFHSLVVLITFKKTKKRGKKHTIHIPNRKKNNCQVYHRENDVLNLPHAIGN